MLGEGKMRGPFHEPISSRTPGMHIRLEQVFRNGRPRHTPEPYSQNGGLLEIYDPTWHSNE
jgi:hypothetical protein